MALPEVKEGLAMCGIAVFAARRLAGTYNDVEQKLAAFLTYLGLPTLPGHAALIKPIQKAIASPRTRPSTRQGGHADSADESGVTHGGFEDPYKEWWSMQFDPQEENKARDYASSINYMLALLQVCA